MGRSLKEVLMPVLSPSTLLGINSFEGSKG